MAISIHPKLWASDPFHSRTHLHLAWCASRVEGGSEILLSCADQETLVGLPLGNASDRLLYQQMRASRDSSGLE